MKKKVTAIALAVCILAVAVIGATMAYFTDTDSKTNTFTFGKVDIDLTEESNEDREKGVKAGPSARTAALLIPVSSPAWSIPRSPRLRSRMILSMPG